MKFDARRVKIAMIDYGYNHTKLAELSGVGRPVLSNVIKTGRARPETIGKIAKALDLSADEILLD